MTPFNSTVYSTELNYDIISLLIYVMVIYFVYFLQDIRVNFEYIKINFGYLCRNFELLVVSSSACDGVDGISWRGKDTVTRFKSRHLKTFTGELVYLYTDGADSGNSERTDVDNSEESKPPVGPTITTSSSKTPNQTLPSRQIPYTQRLLTHPNLQVLGIPRGY